MNRLKFRLAKWLLHSDDLRFVAIKANKGKIWIDGDKDLLRYTDTSGYLWKKEPLKRK